MPSGSLEPDASNCTLWPVCGAVGATENEAVGVWLRTAIVLVISVLAPSPSVTVSLTCLVPAVANVVVATGFVLGAP